MIRVSLLILFIFITKLSYGKLVVVNQPVNLAVEQELLYFPDIKNVKKYTLGFDNIISNYLWFQTVSYFGQHYGSDKEYYWLAHMCDVITELDPRHRIIYEFCSGLVAWEMDNAPAARKLLAKAISFEHDYWRYYYLRAMNYLIFEKNEQAARDDFITAAKCPDAPLFIHRLASKKIANLDSPETSIAFLREMINQAKDEYQRKSLTEQLIKVVNERNIKHIELAKEKYFTLNQAFPEHIKDLLAYDLSKIYLVDPLGKAYKIGVDGQITSSSNIKRMPLFEENNKKEEEEKDE